MDLSFEKRFCRETEEFEAVEFSFLDLEGDLVEGEFDTTSIRFKTKTLEQYFIDPDDLLDIATECIRFQRDYSETNDKSRNYG